MEFLYMGLLYTEDIYWIIGNIIKMRKPLLKCTNFK